jgi:hypothetical protein
VTPCKEAPNLRVPKFTDSCDFGAQITLTGGQPAAGSVKVNIGSNLATLTRILSSDDRVMVLEVVPPSAARAGLSPHRRRDNTAVLYVYRHAQNLTRVCGCIRIMLFNMCVFGMQLDTEAMLL